MNTADEAAAAVAAYHYPPRGRRGMAAAIARVAAGYELIVVDADVLLLRDGAQASLAKLRAEF